MFHKGLAMGPVNTHFHLPIMGLLTDSDAISAVNVSYDFIEVYNTSVSNIK